MAVKQARKRVAGDTENVGGLRHAEAKRVEAVLLNAKAWMGRVLHGHGAGFLSWLVVIDQFDIAGMAILETKNNPPVAGNRDAPESLAVALERM